MMDSDENQSDHESSASVRPTEGSLNPSLSKVDNICKNLEDEISSLLNQCESSDDNVNDLIRQKLKSFTQSIEDLQLNRLKATGEKDISSTDQPHESDNKNQHSSIDNSPPLPSSQPYLPSETKEREDSDDKPPITENKETERIDSRKAQSLQNGQHRHSIDASISKRRLSFPMISSNEKYLQRNTMDGSILTDSQGRRERNISILPTAPMFRRRSSVKKVSSILPMVNNESTGPLASNDTSRGLEETNQRRTLSMHVRPVLEKKPSSTASIMARDAFKLIDVNNDGYLQREEVIAAIAKIQESGGIEGGVDSAELADSMMAEVDIDGDGLIDIDEFVEMMKQGAPGLVNGKMKYHNNRMSQLARNVLLAHQKKVENNVIGHDMWMIHPLSTHHAIWDIFVSLLILLTVITMPLSLGWEELSQALYGITLSVDCIFLLDICKNFCTGFVDENDAIIMDKRIVHWNYLTGFFVTDLASSIPLDLIFDLMGISSESDNTTGAVTGTKHSLKMLKLLRMTKFFRLLRISRLFKYVKKVVLKIEEILHIRISDGFTKLLRLGVGALVLGHWIGCFNFMLVRMNDFPEDSWVVYANLEDKDPFVQWSWSFFKALAQMIMIGFETPPFTNASCDTASHWCSIEHWITLGCLYIGAIFYSLLISSISSVIQTASLPKRQFEEKLVQIDDYMRSKKLPATLREKVKDYFHMQHSDGKLFDEGEILNMVTPILRREIKCFNGREISMKVPLLSAVTTKSFSEDMTSIIEPSISFANETILREKTSGEEMFFISSGVVEIFLNSAKNSAYVAIGDGCYFGDVSLLLNIQRTASARTKTQCVLYSISKENLLRVLQDYPEIMRGMKRVARSRKNRLKHYIDPAKNGLDPEDEIDSEDCKTELFGVDADEVTHIKDSAFENSRRKAHVGIGHKPYSEAMRNERNLTKPIT